jgi:hypothetical protein
MDSYALATGSGAPSLLGFSWLDQVRYGGIPLPLGTGESLGRSLRELLMKGLFILLGGQRCVEAGPFDHHLGHNTIMPLM